MRGFIIKMSVGFDVKIDQDELQKALDGVQRPSPALLRFKQGLTRSDLIAGIIEDKSRIVMREKFDIKTGKGYSEFIPLTDIFSGVKYLSGEKPKELTN